MKLTHYSIIIFMISTFFYLKILYADDVVKNAYIEWIPVEGATGYQVEIKDKTGIIVYNEKINNTKLILSLPHGMFEYRIGIFSKFNKIYKWSPWYILTIVPPKNIINDYYVNHLIGIESGFLRDFKGDIFSSSLKLGILYECHGFIPFLSNLYGGGNISSYYFLNGKGSFKSSWMVTGGIFIGFDYPSYNMEKKSLFNISPFIGYKHYYRVHTYRGREYTASRPILALGTNVNCNIKNRFLIGVAIEYNRIFDNTQVNACGFYLRVGVWL